MRAFLLRADGRNNWPVLISNYEERTPEMSCPIGLIKHWKRFPVVSEHPGSRHRGLDFSLTRSAKEPKPVNRDDLQSSTSPHL